MNVYIIQVSLLNGISEINQLFDDILIIWPAPVYIHIDIYIYIYIYTYRHTHTNTQFINNLNIKKCI